jgi:macrolide-specific efflux system membrane fusion protein
MARNPLAGRIAWWWLLILAAAVGTAALTARGCARSRGRGETLRPVRVVREDLRVVKTATGEVRPQNRVEIKPPIAGRIEEVLVREGNAVTKGQVLAWMSSAERAALLDAAQAQGAEALQKWASAYKAAPLMSPLDGTVIVRAVEPGQTVTTTDPVVVIADRLIVKAQVDETDIAAINVGQPSTISLDAFPREPISAVVDHVAYEATIVNNVTIYEVDVLPQAVPDFMRSGMTATITFIVAEKPGALVVPAEAVFQEDGGSSVRVPAPGSRRPAQREVTTGLTDGKSTEIVSGLQEGETVLAPSLRLSLGNRSQRRNPFAPGGAPRR